MNSPILPRLVLAPVALAAAAVIGFGPMGSAQAAECGQPAVPAVFESVEHPAVLTTVPAVTHLEWTWRRDVASVETEHARTVIDRAHVPAVAEQGHHETRVVTPAVLTTEWEYVQHQTGRTRWEAPGWNAGENGKGWSPTGVTREVEKSAAVTEQVWVIDSPAVAEVTELSHQELVWVAAGAVAPAGYDATGATRPGAPVEELSPGTSAEAPAGVGWTQVAGSGVSVVDEEAHERVEQEAWVEDVLVTPEVPATEACASPVDGEDTDGEDTDGEDTDGEDTDGEDTDGEDGLIVDDIDDPSVEGEVAGIANNSGVVPTAAVGEVLPATGNGVEPWLLALGAVSLLAGAGLVRRSSAPLN
ncbi:LPXTG cell wall anchor domain-containing protein [Nocardioides sp. Root190]|uniref:LPXTG cell wall anchor domain-containing protein n=1 Tax=Nocardioides sp. Root190 TaxID=1736488 RepID=UPI0012F8B315|nr:LPXTG cell wall anchor domain-containing protein [Nocardioides sp. Root190]